MPLKSFSGNVKEFVGYIGQEPKKDSGWETDLWVFIR